MSNDRNDYYKFYEKTHLKMNGIIVYCLAIVTSNSGVNIHYLNKLSWQLYPFFLRSALMVHVKSYRVDRYWDRISPLVTESVFLILSLFLLRTTMSYHTSKTAGEEEQAACGDARGHLQRRWTHHLHQTPLQTHGLGGLLLLH